MTSQEIVLNWFKRPEVDVYPNPEMPDFNEASVDDLINQDSNEEAKDPAYRDFIFKAPAYEWLIANLRKECFLAPAEPNSMEAIRRKIIYSLPSSHEVSRKKLAEAYKITFEIEWDPLAFVKEQKYKEQPDEAIEIAITLIGSAKDAQALTCAQYLRQTWPSAGGHTVQLVKDVLRSGRGHRHICKFPGL
jgi:hypothetical protein